MTHSESSIKIYWTREYSRFKKIHGNRQLNKLKIKRIIDDIESGVDILRFAPVLVREQNDSLEIIDGQHRFHVAKQLKCPVWYIISEDLTLMEIAKINSNTEKWKDSDFINCYNELGNENYKKLQAFINTYGFSVSGSLLILSKGYSFSDGGGSSEFKHKFRSGEFEIKKWDEAVDFANKIILFKEFPYYKSGAFIGAIGKIIRGDKIKFEDLVKKYEKNTSVLTPCGDMKSYLTVLEQIYNIGNHTRRVIY